MCWENRGLGSPCGPGLSMVVPVSWMVSRKIWISWSWEMVWPAAMGVGTGLGISSASCRGVSSWHGVGRCVGSAWRTGKCMNALELHRRPLSWFSGLVRSECGLLGGGGLVPNMQCCGRCGFNASEQPPAANQCCVDLGCWVFDPCFLSCG